MTGAECYRPPVGGTQVSQYRCTDDLPPHSSDSEQLQTTNTRMESVPVPLDDPACAPSGLSLLWVCRHKGSDSHHCHLARRQFLSSLMRVCEPHKIAQRGSRQCFNPSFISVCLLLRAIMLLSPCSAISTDRTVRQLKAHEGHGPIGVLCLSSFLP